MVFVTTVFMANENPVCFTLSDGTEVTVKKVTNDKFDFELKLTNGSRKTFIWDKTYTDQFENNRRKKDELLIESIAMLKSVLSKAE